ncbi:MAG: TetR/AcrR family transcriptional regulator [Candidatus Krumholzibacteriia bacterium]
MGHRESESHGGATGTGADGGTSVRPGRRQRERQRHEQEILAAAAELFARQGYERTSMQQIAQQAEFSIGKLYQHFEGKEAIYHQLVERHCASMLAQMDEAGAEGGPPLERLDRMMERIIGHFDRDRNFLRIYSNENPMNLEGLVEATMRSTLERVSALLRQAIERGELPPEDPELLAAVLVGAGDRLLQVLQNRGDDHPFDAIPDLVRRLILAPLQERAGRGRPDGARASDADGQADGQVDGQAGGQAGEQAGGQADQEERP